ncbi:MAG: HIT domain-containing protein [Candidatus Rhabdochlamydia sp.]
MSCLSDVILESPDSTLVATVPEQQLLHKSLSVFAPQKKFSDWTSQDHAESYTFMQRIAKVWKDSGLTDQYLVYSKVDSNIFKWEMIPYQKCKNVFGRMVQQLQVLWRTVFGGMIILAKNKQDQVNYYKANLKKQETIIYPSYTQNAGQDAFCKQETIDRQWVVIGEKVNVLFNYAPIGFGGDKLHFLITPKEHRKAFTDVTQEEYVESMQLTNQLIMHFSETRECVKNVYLMNKTGVDAGQTVDHWHLHVVFSTNTAQNFWGRITVFKNILFGSSPMKKEALKQKVEDLRNELASYKS